MSEKEQTLKTLYNAYIDALVDCVEDVHDRVNFNNPFEREAGIIELVDLAKKYLLENDDLNKGLRGIPFQWIVSENPDHLIYIKQRKVTSE